MTPRCPRCESTDCAEHRETLGGYEETIESTHECQKCHTRFRFTPPTRSATKEE